MSARTKARKRALDVLFSADVRGIGFAEALADAAARAREHPERAGSWPYAERIVTGVIEHREDIDGLIRAHARGWTLERMPAVDRAILRIGLWEVLHNPEVPVAVVVSEAADAARELSTDESAGFIQGVLAAVARAHARPAPAPGES